MFFHRLTPVQKGGLWSKLILNNIKFSDLENLCDDQLSGR